jgi:hypothetical protein
LWKTRRFAGGFSFFAPQRDVVGKMSLTLVKETLTKRDRAVLVFEGNGWAVGDGGP